MRSLPGALGALLLSVSTAGAAGIDLSWNGCVGSGLEASSRVFTCTGSVNQTYELVLQFRSPVPVPSFSTLLAYLDYQDANAVTLPPFWHYESGGCNGLDASPPGIALYDDLSSFPGCAVPSPPADPWGGDGSGGFESIASYGVDYSRLGNGHLVLAGSRTASSTIAAGTRYYAFNLQLNNWNRSACSSCADPGVIVWNMAQLVSDDGSPTVELSGPDQYSDCVTINSANPSLCGLVPTVSRTWGQLKSLYR